MKYVETLLLAAVAVFTPIRAALATTLILIGVDLVVGLLAAYKRKEPITSSGIKRTVGKVLLYNSAICIGHLVQTYLTGDVLPVCKMVTTLIGIVEAKSIFENLDTINGAPLFKALIDKLVSK